MLCAIKRLRKRAFSSSSRRTSTAGSYDLEDVRSPERLNRLILGSSPQSIPAGMSALFPDASPAILPPRESGCVRGVEFFVVREIVSNDLIALARSLFESLAIQNADHASLVVNKLFPLKGSGDHRNR